MSDLLNSLTAPNKRVKIHDAQMVNKVPKRAKELVEEIAAKREISSSAVVREALGEYFAKRGYRM